MNTIKLYLAESGRIADLKKDFPLYQGQYQNKLLNVFVPTSILAPNFTEQEAGATIADYVSSTAVKIGIKTTERNGKVYISKTYYMRYLKTLTYQNVEYALYERKLPREFTFYAGQGGNAPILIANVVNVNNETTPATILEIVPSQSCSLDVMPSDYLDKDEPIEASDLEEINASINAINETLALKQNIVDGNLETVNKTVVGAINENKAKIGVNTASIEQNSQDIAQNRNEIDELRETIGTGQDYIGTITLSELPQEPFTVLNEYVQSVKGRAPKGGDTIIVIRQIQGDTNRNYKYIFNGDTWSYYEIPLAELASNNIHGLVEGTYGFGLNYATLVDISGGQIINIYIKDSNGDYRNLVEYLQTTNTDIEDIINGNTVVGEAMKALEDGVGNNIANTYLTKTDGTTRRYVRDYAMPRVFNDVDFISATGYQNSAPTTPTSGVQFTRQSTSVGDTTLFNISKQVGGTVQTTFELSSKNGYSNTIYVSADVDCVVTFRLTTKHTGFFANNTLNIELTSPITLTAGTIEKISFGNPFTYLGEKVVTVTDDEYIEQKLEVTTQTSAAITFNVYSNSTYPSTFNLTSQSYVLSDVEQVIGKTILLGADGVLEANRVVLTVQDAESFVEFRTNQRQFLITALLPLVGSLDDGLPVSIEFGDTVYNIYSFMSGGATPLTIGDLKSVMSYNENTGYSFYPRVIFIETSDIVGFVLDQSVVTAKQLLEVIKNSESVSVALDETGTKLVFTSVGGGGGGSVSIDNETITENAAEKIQAVALKDRSITVGADSVGVSNFVGITKLSEAQYQELYTNGTLIVGGTTLNYQNGMIYVTTENELLPLSLTQSNSMLTSQKAFTNHVQVLLEFETGGMHYGADFILHPYDTSICIVSYNFVGHSGTAYLDESGIVNISIPDGLTFTNVKAHYIELGD